MGLANRVSGMWQTVDWAHGSSSSVARLLQGNGPCCEINNRWNNWEGIKGEKKRKRKRKINKEDWEGKHVE
jgi:hypothetical protein